MTQAEAGAKQEAGERRVLHEFVGGNGLPIRLVASGEPGTLPDVEACYVGKKWEKVNDCLHEGFWIREILRLVEAPAPPTEEST